MRRRLIAIQFLLVTLVCAFQFGFTAHFCGGKFIGSKVFLGYAEVSCGMTKNLERCEGAVNLNRRCCENHFCRLEFRDGFQSQVVTDFDLSVFDLIFNQVSVRELYVTLYSQSDAVFPLHPPPVLKVPLTALENLQVFII